MQEKWRMYLEKSGGKEMIKRKKWIKIDGVKWFISPASFEYLVLSSRSLWFDNLCVF